MPPGHYVGPPGSEAQHPGLVRDPMPGWNDPSSPYYERRNYYISPSGKIVAIEPGYHNEAHPYDTGRAGERNTEDESRSGYTFVHMSEPGVKAWGPGQTNPNVPGQRAIDNGIQPLPGMVRTPLAAALMAQAAPQAQAAPIAARQLIPDLYPGQGAAAAAASGQPDRGLPPIRVTGGRYPSYVIPRRRGAKQRHENDIIRALAGLAT